VLGKQDKAAQVCDRIVPKMRRQHEYQRRSERRALGCQLVEQRLRVLEVSGVEALGEPVVNFGEHRALAAILRDSHGVEQRRGQVQPKSFIARPACQIFCMWLILSPSKYIT